MTIDAAYAAKSAWSAVVSGVVRLPKFSTEAKTVMPSFFAAATTFARTIASAADTWVSPGAQTCVIRTARKPACMSRSICFCATSGSDDLTASSAAPIGMPGPAASAEGASANARSAATVARK